MTPHGLRQSVALATSTRAVAVARMSCEVTPTRLPKNVGSGFPCAVFRYTSTRTHKPVSPVGQAVSPSVTSATGTWPQTTLDWTIERALRSAGLPADVFTESYANATAPARA